MWAEYNFFMKRIKLSGKLGNGKFVIVDDKDFLLLNTHSWFLAQSGYAFAHPLNTHIDTPLVSMHRLILNPPKGFFIDHINRNKLDNRRCNLRIASKGQNSMNRPKQKGKYSSIYKGAIWDKGNNRWRSRISLNQKVIYIGVFKTAIEAAKAYDLKAKELFGEFAVVNF